MTILRIFFLALCCLPLGLHAQVLEVQDLELEGPHGMIEGNLSAGATMPLEWAANSSVACFPATRFIEFEGNHLLYRVQIPARSVMTITVKPKSKKTRVNLYALRLGIQNGATPPDIQRAISCEASYPIYVGKPFLKAPSQPQSVEISSVNKPYNIVIGVAGAQGFTEGDFELHIEVKSR